MNRLNFLDVLKAIAIISVIFYHMGYLTYGYLGVDLFLVINGYLITRSLYKKNLYVADSNPLHCCINNYFRFILDKVLRLIPVLLIAEFFCISWGAFVMLPDDYENLSQSIIASNLFSNNILQAITTRNYWDVVNDYKPLMHTWYLGVLMQFYIIYPILFYISKFYKEQQKRFLITSISFFTTISLLTYLDCDSVAERFYYLPSRFFEFGIGGIIALSLNSKNTSNIFSLHSTLFFYICTCILLFSNHEIFSSQIKLLIVVCLSGCLLLSQNNLENSFISRVTSNKHIALFGKMSFSLFIWHQILLAFYRYSFSCDFTYKIILIYLFVTIVLSTISYYLIEKKVSILTTQKKKRLLYSLMSIFYILINICAFAIYSRGGVIRDVPELDVFTSDAHGGQHAEYCDRVNQYNQEFRTNKYHWMVIGNSYGRDFANIILESNIKDSIEISYCNEEFALTKKSDLRYHMADKVFISTLGVTPELVTSITQRYITNGGDLSNIFVVGEKNFGENNGQIYWHKNSHNYHNLSVKMIKGYKEKNEKLRNMYGKNFIDLISIVEIEGEKVRVFTDCGKFISSDCRHLTRAGAIFFANKLSLSSLLNSKNNEMFYPNIR